MTKAILDKATERHLIQWISKYVPERDEANVYAGIVRYVADDPQIVDSGWVTVRQRAEQAGYITYA